MAFPAAGRYVAAKATIKHAKSLACARTRQPRLTAIRQTGGHVSEPLAELLATLANQASVRKLELAGLGEGALRELVGGASEEAVSALRHRTGGNPFFVSQLVGQLESGDRADQVPGGVRDVIRHRLTRLPARADEVLTVASVIGEEFDLQALAEILEFDDEHVLELVEAAVAHRLTAESADAVGRYRFAHALIRETLYGQLSAVRKARLHLRVGQAIERSDGDSGERLVEIADHFYKGAAAGGVDEAYEYAIHAVEQATARLGFEQAEEHLRRARELFERLPDAPGRAEQELDLQLRLGGLLMMTRGYAAPEVGEACARAAELCRGGEVGNEQQLAGSLWRLGVYYEVRGDFATSRQIGEQLLELGSGADGSPVFQLGGRQLISVAAMETGDPATACEHLAVVRQLADSVGDGPADVFGMDFRVTSRSFFAWSTSLLGNTDNGRRVSAESLALARQFGGAHDVAYALFVDALCAVLRRDPVLAGERAEEGAALCADRGFGLFGAMTTMIAGWAVAENGDPDAGAARIADGLAAFEATGAGMMLHFFLALLGEAHLRAGRLREAQAAVEQGLASLETSGRFYEAGLRSASRSTPSPASAAGRARRYPPSESSPRVVIATICRAPSLLLSAQVL